MSGASHDVAGLARIAVEAYREGIRDTLVIVSADPWLVEWRGEGVARIALTLESARCLLVDLGYEKHAEQLPPLGVGSFHMLMITREGVGHAIGRIAEPS